MGTLGTLLSSAREAKGLDLHDAAQQTRISINYLKALEAEDFSKLPGEVFIKGFLKSYAKYLELEESEVVKRYRELLPQAKQVALDNRDDAQGAPPAPPGERTKVPLEPLVWGAVIVIAVIVFLFISVPGTHDSHVQPGAPPLSETGQPETPVTAAKTEKLYLEIMAAEDVWLLVRIDASPQKKAVLKKGESVTWSADERFLLSYGSAGAVKLLLNGKELAVTAAKDAVVRDLAITGSGIIAQKRQADQQPKPLKPRPQAQPPDRAPETVEPPEVPLAPKPLPRPPHPESAPAQPIEAPRE